MACSVPWPIKGWFERHHRDICDNHDAAYVTRVWSAKVAGDFVVSATLAERGCYLLAYLAVPYLAVCGTLYWLWKKWSA